jgi:hypothetical protein
MWTMKSMLQTASGGSGGGGGAAPADAAGMN